MAQILPPLKPIPIKEQLSIFLRQSGA